MIALVPYPPPTDELDSILITNKMGNMTSIMFKQISTDLSNIENLELDNHLSEIGQIRRIWY